MVPHWDKEIMRLVSQAPRVCGGSGLIGALLFQTGEATVRKREACSQPDGPEPTRWHNFRADNCLSVSFPIYRIFTVATLLAERGHWEARSQRAKVYGDDAQRTELGWLGER